MPISATERFSRTYSPRVPDDSYDSLGGGIIPDSIILAPVEKPYEQVRLTSGLVGGVLAMTLVPTGQIVRINLSTSYTSGALSTSGIGSGIQTSKIQLTAAMAGGTLH